MCVPSTQSTTLRKRKINKLKILETSRKINSGHHFTKAGVIVNLATVMDTASDCATYAVKT